MLVLSSVACDSGHVTCSCAQESSVAWVTLHLCFPHLSNGNVDRVRTTWFNVQWVPGPSTCLMTVAIRVLSWRSCFQELCDRSCWRGHPPAPWCCGLLPPELVVSESVSGCHLLEQDRSLTRQHTLFQSILSSLWWKMLPAPTPSMEWGASARWGRWMLAVSRLTRVGEGARGHLPAELLS